MKKAVLMSCLAILAACGNEPEAPPPTPVVSSGIAFDLARVERGAQLYQAHCLECHGPQAQGHPAWGQDEGGFVAAPPLDGSGPSAARTKPEWLAVIKHGMRKGGQPVMPGWQGRMSEQDMEDILLWVQSMWPIEVYERWQQANRASVP